MQNEKFPQINNNNITSELAKSENKFKKGVIFNGNRSENKIALTFDADLTGTMLYNSNNIYNYEIENILRQHQIKSTVFVTGLWAEYYKKQLKELSSDTLFEIGNHSYYHKSFTQNCYGLRKLNDNEKKADILKAQETIKGITGTEPVLFRFPGGCYTDKDAELVNDNNLCVIQWDVISGDAVWKSPGKIVRNVLNNVKNGSIIIMHFTGNRKTPATAESLKIIIRELKSRGFEFVKVSELINQ
jgi:peptidoglycan/xylan/chitin deacetylase (PgdA/CDA1 family)